MNGQDFVCVRDPETFAQQPLFLNRALVHLVSRMDGEHSLRDIQADYFRVAGEILPIETLEDLVKQLDEQFYLEGPPFREFHGALIDAYKKAPARPARHAGSAYQGTREALLNQLQGYFEHPEGPAGKPALSDRPVRGLIAPHIDFSRGGPTYAHAYHALSSSAGIATYIIFGTCHTPMPQRFSVTEKDYETPLGTVRTDKDFVRRLLSRIGGDYLDDVSHRGEHSIEFQAVCLNYIRRDQPDFMIVPILVGSFHDILTSGGKAGEDPEIERVVAAVRDTIEETPGEVCIIAGADLAHVGRRFGDFAGPTEESLSTVEREDRAFLSLVESGDAEGAFASIAADNDRRRVCGYPPIYMTLRSIANPKGRLLQYRQWSDQDEGAAVTYAALALH